MVKRLTARDIRTLSDIVVIGDVLLLPQLLVMRPVNLGLIRLEMRYELERRRKKEPAWIVRQAQSIRGHLRTSYEIRDDTLANVLALPYTGLSYKIRDEGFAHKVCSTFGLWRLDGIKQLGFLQAPYYNSHWIRQPLSEGNRLTHSFDVYAIASVIGRNCRLPKPLLYTLLFRALTHDMGTTAGGDSVKSIDLPELDEDRNYTRLVRSHRGWGALCDRYEIIREMLFDEDLRDNGMVGQLLDIADKIAYVARDTHLCFHHIEAGAAHDFGNLKALEKLVKEEPLVCSLWDSVDIDHGRVVFTDPDRLATFLRLRVMLFSGLYYNPASRFGEFVMSRWLVRSLYRSGKLSRRDLITMQDAQLMWRLEEEFGRFTPEDLYASGHARQESFETPEEAERFVAHLRERGIVIALIDDDRRAIKPGLEFLVRTPSGTMSIAEARPAVALEIERIARGRPMVHVYWIDGDPALPKAKLEKLMEYL